MTIKHFNITTTEDVKEFFAWLTNEAIPFHPDDSFHDYEGITFDEATELDLMMDKCFDVCEEAGEDIYAIALECETKTKKRDMKTLQEMKKIVDLGEAKLLTIEAARELKGKKIQTIHFGYAHQDGTDEFVVGDITTEMEYYRNLKEECFPDQHGNRNRAEYWESYMTASQLKRKRERLILLREDGTSTSIFYDPAEDYDKNEVFSCSDIDRWVFYIEAV